MIVRRSRSARVAATGLALACGLSLAACSTSESSSSAPAGGAEQNPVGAEPAGGTRGEGRGAQSAEDAAGPTVTMNVDQGASSVPVSTVVEVTADSGSLSDVVVRGAGGVVPGELSDDGRSWTASDRLEPGERYAVTAVADDGGRVTRERSRFTTQALTLDEQTFASVAPLDGETVGVGMPVVVSFDVAVTDRAEFERHMQVTSRPAQQGSWYWLDDHTAHWRPQSYWKPGSRVHVDIDINGVDAGNGIWGQETREIDFEVGDAHIYRVDAQSHQMKVFSNGELLRTLPITTGKAPDFVTRSGIKVIMEKFESKRMNSETVGIPAGSAESYDIDNVQYAMRVTNSGEFIHAAPWSVSSQGNANVSHGCTGMSTEDAAWLYAMSRRGDVVEYTGTDRPMTFDNGYGDWNTSFRDYQQGSALA